jgi:hypothetical protein
VGEVGAERATPPGMARAVLGGSVVAILLVALLLFGCASDPDDGAAPDANSPDDEQELTTSAGEPSDEEPRESTAPSTGGEENRSDTDPVEFDEVYGQRQEIIGQELIVAGKVLFRLDCASQAENVPPCVATAYLVDLSTTDLPLYEETAALPLHVDGHSVSCGTPTLTGDFQCQGFQHDRRYQVTGSLERLVLGGRTTDDLVLEVRNKEQS